MDELHLLGDEDLQKLAGKGDSQAEEFLVQRFGRLVRASARPLFLAGGDSEDLTQEGMLGLLSAIRTFSPDLGVSFRSYAALCIRRRLLNAIKTASRYKHNPLNQAVSFSCSHFDKHFSVQPKTPEEQILSQEQADELQHTLGQVLSHFEYDVLGLFLEGESYQKMAEALEKPVKSIDNAVQRIRKKLEKFYQK